MAQANGQIRRTAVLLVDCPDAKGIVASVSTFLYTHGANILDSDQHQDNQAGLFFMRVEFDLADFTLDAADFARRHFRFPAPALPCGPAAPAPDR
jgi:formyltetrahydrofolate deformylase